MRQSVITLSSVSLTSSGEKTKESLNSMTIIETLQTCFNVGTEKPKTNATHNGLCPLQHMTLNSMHAKIMVTLGNYLMHKKSMTEENDKTSDESPPFKPNYDLNRCMFDNVFQMSKSNKLYALCFMLYDCIGCKLSAHRSVKEPQNYGTHDLKALKDE